MSKKIKRVYIAGSLTPTSEGNHAIEYLANVRKFVRTAIDLIMCGYVPFCPGADFIYFLSLRPDEVITDVMIKRMSKDWLAVCDAMVLTPGWQKSKGTLAEIEYAEKHGIPVFKSLAELTLVT